MDEAIANFTAITSASAERAQQYLTLTDGNLEQAIQLFFDSDGADMGASVPPSSSAAQPSQPGAGSRPSYSEDARGVVTIDSDDDNMDEDSSMGGVGVGGAGASNAFEDDEAMARRLQQEAYGQAGAEQDEVRAPMARTTETLVGPDAAYYGGADDDNTQSAVMEQIMNRQRRGGFFAAHFFALAGHVSLVCCTFYMHALSFFTSFLLHSLPCTSTYPFFCTFYMLFLFHVHHTLPLAQSVYTHLSLQTCKC